MPDPTQEKPKIPSFNEVMGGGNKKQPIPSFNEVMGEKKNGGSNGGDGVVKSAPIISKLPSQESSVSDGSQVFPTKENPTPYVDMQQAAVPEKNITPSITNNFGMPSATDLAKQNSALRDNTQTLSIPVLKQKNVLGEDVNEISDGEDEGVKLAKEYANNKKILDNQHNIINSQILNTYQDIAVTKGDTQAPKLFTPIPIKEENKVVNDLDSQKNEVTAKANELRNETIKKAGLYASKINANATTAGLTTRAILGDKAAIQQSDFLDKGLPVAPSDLFYNDQQGLEALSAGIDEQYKDDLDNPEYIAKKNDIQNQYKTLIDKYPEFKRQQVAKIVAQEIMKEHPNADGMMTLPYGIEAAKKLGLSEEDIKNIDFDNLPIQSPLSSAAGAVYNGIIGLGAGAARILGTAVGMDKDVLTSNLGEATRNATARFEDVSNTQGLPTIVDADKTSPTYLQDIVNPEAGKYNYNFHTIANAIGHGMGGLAQFIGGTRVVGGIVKGALPFVDATEAGMAGLMVLQGYEPYYKQAAEVISDKPEDEWKRHAFALVNGSLDYLGFRSLGKVVKEIAPEAKNELANIFKEAPSLAKVNRNALTKWTQKVVKGIEETAGETAFVGGATAGSEIAKNIVINTIGTGEAAKKANRELGSVLLTGVETLPFAIAIPVGMSKVIAGARNSFLYKENIYNAGLNPETYLGQATKLFHDGIITQDQLNQRAQVVNTAAKVVNSIPSDIELNHNQRVAYTNSKVRELALKAQKEKVDDAALEKFYDDQIKQEVVARTEILNGGSKEPPYVKPEVDTKLSEPIEGLDEQGIPTDAKIESAVIEIGGKTYEGKNHAEAILKAKAAGEDISQVNRSEQGQFKLSDGTIINRQEAKNRFGQDRAELLIPQDEAAKQANKDYKNETSQTETKVPDTRKKASTTNEAVDNVSQKAESGTNETGLISQAIDIVNTDVVKGFSAETLKDAANNKPEDFKNYLSEIAQQAHDKNSVKATVDTYGQPLVDIATKLFPKKEAKPYDPNSGKVIVEPSKPIAEMNSEELYDYSQVVKKALAKQDKEFKNKTEAEKEAAGYYDYIDNVSDLRDAAERVNFVENAENLNELANSTKSALRDFKKDNPSQESLAILNAAKKRADELNIEPETLIKEVIKKVGNDYKDKDDAEFMMRNYLEKIAPTESVSENKPTISKEQTEPTTKEVEGVSSNSNEANPALKDVESTAKALDEIEKNNPKLIEDLQNKNTLDNSDVEEIKIPDGIESESNWQSKLVEKALKDTGVLFSKHRASTGTNYFYLETKSGDDIKIRLSNHGKGVNGSLLKRQTDGNIIFNDATTPQELLQLLREQLPDNQVLKNTSIAEEYHKQKSYKNITNLELVKAVEDLINKNESNRNTTTEVSPKAGVSSNSNEGVEIDKNKTHFELSDNKLIMVRSDGSKQLYGEYKDLDEANSDLQRLNAEYQGYENKYPIIKVVKDNVGLSTAEIEVKKRGGNNLIKPNGDGKYKVVEVSNINKEAFDKLKSDYDRNVSLSEKNIEIQKLTDALDRTNTPIQIKKLNDAIAKAKEERENIQNQSSLTKPINETTTTEVSPTIPTKESVPKEQGNKEAVQPSTESTGRPNAETETTVLKEGKYKAKAKKIADDIRKAELPSWLVNTDPTIKKSGVSAESLKNTFADAVELAGELLDKGVEVKDAIKQAADKIIDHILTDYPKGAKLKSERESQIRDGFEKYYNDNILKSEEIKSESGKGNKPPTNEVKVAEGEDNTIGIRHVDTAEIREEFGLPDYQKEAQTVELWNIKADERIKNGEMPSVINKFKEGDLPSAVEQVMMGKYIAELGTKAKETMSDKDIQALHDAVKLSDRFGGSEWGASGRARQIEFIRDDSLEGFILAKLEANKVDVLTDKQKEEVKKQFEDIDSAEKKWESEKKRLEDKIKKLEAAKEIKKYIKPKSDAKKTHEDYVKERQSLKEKLRQQVEDYKAAGRKLGAVSDGNVESFIITAKMAKTISEIVKSHVFEIGNNLGEVTKRTFDDVKDFFAGISESDIHDVIAGKYNEPQKTRSQKMKDLVDLKTQARLVNKLSDLQNGKRPTTEKKTIERNREIAELRRKIADFEKENPDNAAKLAALKKRYATEIKKVQDDIDNKRYAPPPKEPSKIILDKEALEAKDELIRLKNERHLGLLREQMEAMSTTEKAIRGVAEIANIPRSIMASGDLSAPLRQAIIPVLSHPTLALKSGKLMVEAAVSQKTYDRWFFDFQQTPRYDLMNKSKLGITESTSPLLTAREEAFMSNLAEKIPIVGSTLIKGSERAYTLFLNKMRVDLFNRFADSMEARGLTFENSPEQYKQMAAYVNNSTGRGDLGNSLNKIAPLLNSLFFSPRLIASRINMLTYLAQPRFYNKVPKEVRRAYFTDMTKFIALGATVLSLASLNKDDKTTVETNPTSSDFGKIRNGNTRWDIWGGFQQYIRVASQAIMGKRTSNGKTTPLGEKSRFGETRLTPIMQSLRGKLAPVPSMALDLFSGRTIIGDKVTYEFGMGKPMKYKEVTIDRYVRDHLLPLTFTGMSDALQDQGTKAWFTVGLPSIFGVGVQTYDTKKKKPSGSGSSSNY